MSFQDLTAVVIRDLQEQQIRLLSEGQTPETEESESVKKSPYQHLYEKIRPSWRAEDREALRQLRVATDRLVQEEFGTTLDLLDGLYSKVRVAKSGKGKEPLRDQHGRVEWELDEQGQPREDWSRVTTAELEKLLFDLERVRFVVSQRLSELFLEAVFAKNVANDIWYEEYESVIEGTNTERTARANRAYKQDKYFSFYRYYI